MIKASKSNQKAIFFFQNIVCGKIAYRRQKMQDLGYPIDQHFQHAGLLWTEVWINTRVLQEACEKMHWKTTPIFHKQFEIPTYRLPCQLCLVTLTRSRIIMHSKYSHAGCWMTTTPKSSTSLANTWETRFFLEISNSLLEMDLCLPLGIISVKPIWANFSFPLILTYLKEIF